MLIVWLLAVIYTLWYLHRRGREKKAAWLADRYRIGWHTCQCGATLWNDQRHRHAVSDVRRGPIR